MEVDSYFQIVEDIVKQEQVVLQHEGNGIDKALGVQEGLESPVILIALYLPFKRVVVVVPLCVEELVSVVSQVPLGKVMFDEELAGFESSVVNDWQNILVVYGLLNDLLPNLLICVLSEKQVEYHI